MTQVTIDKDNLIAQLSSRKMTLSELKDLDIVDLGGQLQMKYGVLLQLSDITALPVGRFIECGDDLKDGVKISRKDQSFKRDEIRNGKKYYTYHHLATTTYDPNLMALRLDVHCKSEDDICLNSGHESKELVYVTKGKVQVQWRLEGGEIETDILNEGDSIFVQPNVPHSFTAIDSKESAEIIAVNYE